MLDKGYKLLRVRSLSGKNMLDRENSIKERWLDRTYSIKERLLEREYSIKEQPLCDEEGIFEEDEVITSTVLLSTLVTVFGALCSGCGAGYSSAAHSGVTEDLNLSIAQFSMFGSIMIFGGMIGAVFSGKIADVLGRRRTMFIAEAFCGNGWLAIAFAKNSWWLNAGRLLQGIGFGLFSYVIPVYIAEITPKHVRGTFVFANQLMQNCGISLFFIIGNVVPWRTLALIGFIPSVLHVIGLFFIPESPRWLGKCGREKECRAALQRLRGQDADISLEAELILDTTESSERQNFRIKDLFQKKYAQPLIIGVGLMLLQQLCGSTSITCYASIIFKKGGFPSGIGTVILAVVMVPKAIMGMFLVDKLGRRTLLMYSATGMLLSGLILSLSFGFQSLGILEDHTPLLTFIGVLGSITTFAMGLGGLPWIIMSEIFPMDAKASAGTLVTLTNWSVGWIVTYAFNFLLEWDASGTFFIFSCVCASCIAFVYMMVPETKGKTLEEIQALLNKSLQ